MYRGIVTDLGLLVPVEGNSNVAVQKEILYNYVFKTLRQQFREEPQNGVMVRVTHTVLLALWSVCALCYVSLLIFFCKYLDILFHC